MTDEQRGILEGRRSLEVRTFGLSAVLCASDSWLMLPKELVSRLMSWAL